MLMGLYQVMPDVATPCFIRLSIDMAVLPAVTLFMPLFVLFIILALHTLTKDCVMKHILGLSYPYHVTSTCSVDYLSSYHAKHVD
jgi:succinate-acetate transporter protein